MIVEEKLLYIL